jgi:hypothetical protein
MPKTTMTSRVVCSIVMVQSEWDNTPKGNPQSNRVQSPNSAVACVCSTLKWETAKPAQPAQVCLLGSAMAAHCVGIMLARRDSDSNIALRCVSLNKRRKTLSGEDTQ